MTTENRIQELMTEQGRSVNWMLENLEGIDYRKLRRFRKNEQQPSIHDAQQIADLFGVPIDYLIKND